ncbi:MAG: hypothetical protein JWN46_2372 [Acidimicrobiales bacterium]|nr:hypothetical protein [Acidimicrobiales bacterium]
MIATSTPPLRVRLMVSASVGLRSGFWFAAGLSWLTHIAVDRVSGFGRRAKDGWRRG